MKHKNILSNFAILLLVSSTAWSMEDDTISYGFRNSNVSFKEERVKLSEENSAVFTKPYEPTTPPVLSHLLK
jgi:uncharacterized protein involved in cysteine biosynthesis